MRLSDDEPWSATSRSGAPGGTSDNGVKAEKVVAGGCLPLDKLLAGPFSLCGYEQARDSTAQREHGAWLSQRTLDREHCAHALLRLLGRDLQRSRCRSRVVAKNHNPDPRQGVSLAYGLGVQYDRILGENKVVNGSVSEDGVMFLHEGNFLPQVLQPISFWYCSWNCSIVGIAILEGSKTILKRGTCPSVQIFRGWSEFRHLPHSAC